MQRFNVLVVRPANDLHYQAYVGAAEHVYAALRRLGHLVRIAENQMVYDATNIVFGAHNLDDAVAEELPANSIIYNTEMVVADSPFLAGLEPFVRRFETWDYSKANVEAWRSSGVSDRVRWLPPGYLPESSTIDPATPTDIDALFYGNVNPRRAAILDDIARHGVALHVTSTAYGPERDALIARSRIILNIHSRDDSALEFARVLHALANQRALLTEAAEAEAVDADLRAGIAAAPARELGRICRELLDDDTRRLALASHGFELLRRRDYVSTLRDALAKRRS